VAILRRVSFQIYSQKKKRCKIATLFLNMFFIFKYMVVSLWQGRVSELTCVLFFKVLFADLVKTHLAPQFAAADLEQPGRLLLAALGLFQGQENSLFLQGL
jgi:hypothetical protein